MVVAEVGAVLGKTLLSAGVKAAYDKYRASTVPDRLGKEVVAWAGELPKERRIGAVRTLEILKQPPSGIDELPAQKNVLARFAGNVIPSPAEWLEALVERWTQVKRALEDTKTEAQAFFSIAEADARVELTKLAERLYLACGETGAAIPHLVIRADEIRAIALSVKGTVESNRAELERILATGQNLTEQVGATQREVVDASAAVTTSMVDARRDLAAMGQKLELILERLGLTFASPPPASANSRSAADSVLLQGARAMFSELVTPAKKDLWDRHWFIESIPLLQRALAMRDLEGDQLYKRAQHWLWAAYLEAALVLRDPPKRRSAWTAAHELAPGADGQRLLREGPAWETDIGNAYHEALAVVYYALSLEFNGRNSSVEDLLVAHAATCRVAAETTARPNEWIRLTDELLDGLVSRGLLNERFRRPIPVAPVYTSGPSPLPIVTGLNWECARCHRVRPIALDTTHADLQKLSCQDGHSLLEAYGRLLHLVEDRLRLGRLTHALARLEGHRVQDHRLLPVRSFAIQRRLHEHALTLPVFDHVSLTCERCTKRFVVGSPDLSTAYADPQVSCTWCKATNRPFAISRSRPVVDADGRPVPGMSVDDRAEYQLSDVHDYNCGVESVASWEQSPILLRLWDALGRVQFTVDRALAIAPTPD